MGELEDWINSVSGESNDEKEPTYTNIFAQLYDNGDGSETLVFTSDDSYRENGLTYKQSYDITDEHFIMGEGSMPPWLDASTGYMNSTIKTVKIVDEIKPKYTSCMFAALTTLENIEGMKNLNTENTIDMAGMFIDCASLTNLDLRYFNTSNVTDMTMMFYFCQSLTSLDLSSFDTKKATKMTSMFMSCANLTTINVGTNWTTDNANTSKMFEYCGTDHVTPKS